MVHRYMKEVLLVFDMWIEAMDLGKHGLHLLFELHHLHIVLLDFLFIPILFSKYRLKTHDMILLVSLGNGQFPGESGYYFISRRRYE